MERITCRAYQFMQKCFLDAFIFPETLEVISSKTQRYLFSMILNRKEVSTYKKEGGNFRKDWRIYNNQVHNLFLMPGWSLPY